MRRKNVRVITYTGVMIAVTLLFQSLRLFFPGLVLFSFGTFSLMQILIGALVNLCLLITSWNAGIAPGLLLSFLAPVAAFMQGQLPIPHMIAVVSAGNAIYCLIAWIPFATAGTRFALTILAALAKFGLLSLLVLRLVVPVLLPAALTGAPQIEKVAAALTGGFVWPQLLTGVLGGLLAYAISPRLPKITE